MKKLLSVMMTVALAVGCLTGCGGGSAEKTEKSADAFYIGGIGPTTGAAAIYGNAAKNGAQIAIDEINEAGGINGYQVEFKAEDDQNDAEKSVNAYNSLKDWGMQVLMGTVTTTPCIAVADKTAEDGMFEITPSASSTDVIENDNVFQACFTDPNQGTASAQYIGENNLHDQWNYSEDGASLICRLLFIEASDINFYVGRAVNPAHQNPDLPINFHIKMNLVDELSKCLRKMGKRIKVSYF